MCNSMNLQAIAALLSGPATKALEHQVSKKRRLTYNTTQASPATQASFDDFDSMFQSVSSDDEAFPSIGWNFDDESSNQESLESLHASLREDCLETNSGHSTGMRRSKTLKRGLSSLDTECLNERAAEFVSVDKTDCTPFRAEVTKVDCLPMFSKPAAFKPRSSLTRRNNLRASRTLSSHV